MTELQTEWLKEIVVFVQVWNAVVFPVLAITLGLSMGNFVLLIVLHGRLK